MIDMRQQADHARRMLQSYKGRPPQNPCTEAMRWWHLKYTALICDYMCEELADERLLEWVTVFTALHELVGMGYRHFEDADVVTEEQAWRRVDAGEHVAFCRQHSLNPPGTDPSDFLGEYRAFLAFLGDQAVISPAVVERLRDRYAAVCLRRAA